MVNAEGGSSESSLLSDAEITATRRPGSVERPGYVPLVSPNHPLLHVVAGCSFLPCNGILPAGACCGQSVRQVQNSRRFNHEDHRIQHRACLHALNNVDMR